MSNEQLTSLQSADLIEIFLPEKTMATCVSCFLVGLCSMLGLSTLAGTACIV